MYFVTYYVSTVSSLSFSYTKMKMKIYSFCFFFIISLVAPYIVLSIPPPFSCGSSKSENIPFCNITLPINERVNDIISKLSLEEKVSQLGDISPPIDRLDIPGYKWWSESLHGIASNGRGIRFNGTIKAATSFPQVIHTAASFNSTLWYRIGEAIGTEARALYNAGQAEGLTFWSPNINLFRDPRWGRGQETPGEDPIMNGDYAIAYVRGLQGDSEKGGASNDLKVSACCKHFTAYDLDNWEGVTRYTFNAKVSAQDLEDSYQPPFRSCIKEGGASGLMCSYNQVNGVPTCADFNFLTKTARQTWGFNGYVASDCDAVSTIYKLQGYAKTPEDAVGYVLKAGMDVNCGHHVQKYGISAVKQGKASEEDINRSLINLFSIRMRLGLFNGDPKNGRYGDLNPSHVCTSESKYLALEAARQGIVLLKNSANLLPLSNTTTSSIGIIGPSANIVMLGNYAGPPCQSITPLQAIQNYVNNTQFSQGCENVTCATGLIDEAVELAKSVDQVVMFMGLDSSQEKEKLDRVDLVLPGKQEMLIKSVAEVAKKPIILVLLCGGPVDVSFAKDNVKIGGILWAGYPGEAGGLAIADVIFGEHNPGGRLPVTWYPQEYTKIPMTDMRMRPDPASGYPGRTYRFYTGTPVFKFGYGLSYSNFTYEFEAKPLSSTIHLNKAEVVLQSKEDSQSGAISYDISNMKPKQCKKLEIRSNVRVRNHGPMDGNHSILLFLRSDDVSGGKPMKQLIAFENASIKNGESVDVEFQLKPCEHLSRIGEDGKRYLDEGPRFLVVGDQECEISVKG